MEYKVEITKEELEEIIGDAWLDGWINKGEYQAAQGEVYTEETINELVKEGKIKGGE